MSRISKGILGSVGIALAAAGAVQATRLDAASTTAAMADASHLQAQPASAAPSALAAPRELLNRYCVTCHNERLRTAGLLLDKVEIERVGENAEVLEKVVRKLRTGAMPPKGMPRPDKSTSDQFTSWLKTALDRADAVRPNPGRPAIHRLNRAEYTNAIRELLSLDIDGRSLLPADDAAHGFDNIADLLSVSTGLLERYMSAAKKISRIALGDPAVGPVVETYDVAKRLLQDDRMSEELPFGSRGGVAIRHYFPLDGEYIVTVRLRNVRRGAGEQLEVRVDRARIQLFTVGGQPPEGQSDAAADAAGLTVRFPVKAGTRTVAVAFLKKAAPAVEGLRPARLPNSSSNTYPETAVVGSVEIGGPYQVQVPGDTASRRQIFVCRPASSQDEEPCAKRILAALARRAYRRPVTDEDVQLLLGFYRDARAKGGFDTGIQRALERILVDPEFLVRFENDPPQVPPATAYRLGDIELASRLSFFLWSSIPDDELLDLAERGKLRNAAVLEEQVRRMLSDARSNALVSNFASQWLYLRNMRAVMPDLYAFPEFDDSLREAFQRETELFLDSQLREDRSISDLLTANYTFVNERLARHYGIPNVSGSHFRRVTLNGESRAGLLGHGSILTVTSYATRTSPVVRGKWLLENILGAPPPPPPPNVPALKENGEGEGAPRSVRELMEEHRKNPVCASCHAQMDPLGFALENFDAIGRWRTIEAGTEVDSSGALPDGTTFRGPAGLRDMLLSRRVDFVTTVATKMLTYALGRGVEYYDAPAIRKIVRDSAGNDHRWSSLVMGIVRSAPFQMRRSEQR